MRLIHCPLTQKRDNGPLHVKTWATACRLFVHIHVVILKNCGHLGGIIALLLLIELLLRRLLCISATKRVGWLVHQNLIALLLLVIHKLLGLLLLMHGLLIIPKGKGSASLKLLLQMVVKEELLLRFAVR